MARVGTDQYAAALDLPCAREMDFTGKALKGFIYVSAEGVEEDRDLESWLARALSFVESLPPR